MANPTGRPSMGVIPTTKATSTTASFPQPPQSPQVAPALIGHETRAALIGITCMLLVLCIAAVAGRVAARRIARAALQADDYISALALLLLVVASVENFLFAHYISKLQGPGPPSIEAVRVVGHLSLANPITYGSLMATARTSVLLLYRRIFSLSSRYFRGAWWICVWLILGYFVVFLAGSFTQCSPLPISTLWKDPAKCHPSNIPIMIMGFLNAFIDMCVLVLPIRPVWKLQMSYGRRLTVCGLFALGILGVAISLARAAILTNPKAFQGGGGIAFTCWSTAESAVTLLCACLPLLRPIFIRAYGSISAKYCKLFSARRSTRLESQTFPLKEVSDPDILPITTTRSSRSHVWGLKSAHDEIGHC